MCALQGCCLLLIPGTCLWDVQEDFFFWSLNYTLSTKSLTILASATHTLGGWYRDSGQQCFCLAATWTAVRVIVWFTKILCDSSIEGRIRRSCASWTVCACAGLQYVLPATWTAVKKLDPNAQDRSSLMLLSRLWSLNPSQIAGIGSRKGQIAKGFDADFVVKPCCSYALQQLALCARVHCTQEPCVLYMTHVVCTLTYSHIMGLIAIPLCPAYCVLHCSFWRIYLVQQE